MTTQPAFTEPKSKKMQPMEEKTEKTTVSSREMLLVAKRDVMLQSILNWVPYPENKQKSTSKGKSTHAHMEIVLAQLTASDLDAAIHLFDKKTLAASLAGRTIVVEGGVGQGKTTMCRHMHKIITEEIGMECFFQPEPVPIKALETFIEFQRDPPPESSETPEDTLMARSKSSCRMQYKMMRNRSKLARKAAKVTARGGVALLDRGMFGDAAFMHTTFTRSAVDSTLSMQYLIETLYNYLTTGLLGENIIVIRMKCSPKTALERWLRRERDTTGNKYTLEYVTALEHAHDLCTMAWGGGVTIDTEGACGPDENFGEYNSRIHYVLSRIAVP